MNLIHQQASMRMLSGTELKSIEFAARNCYASQSKMTPDSAEPFIKELITRGHEAPLEFAHATFDITTSRAVLAELTRHRLASFCVESQRYIDEKKTGDIDFIIPEWYNEEHKTDAEKLFELSCGLAEDSYGRLRAMGMKPEQAREVLPNATACRIIMCANFREWRHIFRLRTSPAAYPAMRSLMNMMLHDAQTHIPVVFDDIGKEEKGD